MRILVTAGGTLGHINPALAIIKEFQKKEKKLDVLYIGTHNRMEKEVVPKEKIAYEAIEIYGLSKKDMIRNIKNVFLIQKAYKKCINIMKEFRPDVVIGVGGYVTYPVIKAANHLKIPTFLHEQNSIPGKSNIVLSKMATKVGVTFETSKKYLAKCKDVVYTGHPCGARALDIPKFDKTKFGLSKVKKLVVCCAGSLGSESLSEKMEDFLKSMDKENFELVYITGKGYYEKMTSKKWPKNVFLFPNIENLPGLLKCADVVISRAGAASLSEITALAIPSIIIPSPNVANNHQYYNALELKEKNAILLLEEKNVTAKTLHEMIYELLHDKEKSLQLKMNMRLLKVQNSSEVIYNEIKDMIK